MRTLLNTSHPGLTAALRRDPHWTQVSSRLYGDNRDRSRQSIARSAKRKGIPINNCGYGGHFRAVQGFRFLSD
jgi:hypothetical protein